MDAVGLVVVVMVWRILVPVVPAAFVEAASDAGRSMGTVAEGQKQGSAMRKQGQAIEWLLNSVQRHGGVSWEDIRGDACVAG